MRIWLESGKWNQRGLRKGQYVLALIDKRADWTVDNVAVVGVSENIIATRAIGSKKLAVAGVEHKYPKLSKGWVARYNNRYLGYFPTQAEAAAARAEYMRRVGK